MRANLVNRRWVLTGYPDSMPDESHFELQEENSVPVLKDGEILVHARFLSVDPYMRGRIAPGVNYAAGVKPGSIMQGGGVGEVIESRSSAYREGEIVETRDFGWQEYAVLGPKSVINKVDPDLAPIHSSLSYLGMPGLTAYVGLFEVIRAQPGDTVVVSAASGAVGQVVGQLGKAHGCQMVAVASSEEKLNWCNQVGYAVGVNYRVSAADLPGAIQKACPNGVDGYFDNTAGPVHDAVMENLAQNARIAVCGTISLADRLGETDLGPRYHRQILVARARIQGFIVYDFAEKYSDAKKQILDLIQTGEFQFKEDISEGIETMASSFLKLLHSENFGKQLVKV